MTITHTTTAVAGENISTTKWNENHTISNGASIMCLTFLANSDGETVTCTDQNTWYDVPHTEVRIPGGKTLVFTHSEISVHGNYTSASTPVEQTYEVQVIETGGAATIGESTTITADGDNTHMYYSAVSTWTTSDTTYNVQVRCTGGAAETFIGYNVTLYLILV